VSTGPRQVRALAVPADRGVLAVLPALAAALDGEGPALAPREAASAATGLAEPLGTLAEGEDDPADPTVLLLGTSGSTGVPRRALLPASALRASAQATATRLAGRPAHGAAVDEAAVDEAPGAPADGAPAGGAPAFEAPADAHWLLAVPAWHVAGMQVLVRSVLSGTTPVALDLSHRFDPGAFAVAAAELPVTSQRCTSLVPTQLGRLLDAGGAAARALASFDAVLVGGAALSPALAARAREAGVRVVATYGSSETCGGCVYDGVPLDGVGVTLRDTTADGVGRVAVAGPVVARGYWGRPDLTLRAFSVDTRGRREVLLDDAGRWTAGRLEVLGRLDDAVTTGGLTVAPAVVEAALSSAPGVREVVVVGTPDPHWGEAVVAVVVPESGRAPTLDGLREHAGRTLPGHAAPRRLVLVDRMPVRGPGKPDRAALRALAALAGSTPPRGPARSHTVVEGD
jgi:o-succinylbenzoate---CoA ligase